MMMQSLHVRPIFSALWRNKAAVVLIGAQIALTLAIMCNALFIMSQRLSLMGRPSGMDEANTFIVSSNGFGARFNVVAATDADLAMLRRLPGIKAAAPVLTVPFRGNGWTEDLSLARDQKHPTTDDVSIYYTDDHGLDAYGVSLIAGRNFLPEEVRPRDDHANNWPRGAVITQALARRLFLDTPAVGKEFYLGDAQITVLGVIDRLQHFDPHHRNNAGDRDLVEYSVIFPQVFLSHGQVNYLIRTDPARRDELMRTVEARLAEINPDRTVEGVVSVEQLRHQAYGGDRAIALVLLGVVLILLVITSLGVAGLTHFWVAQRTRQIGVRRALGATAGNVLHHFQVENFILISLGLVAGIVLAYALNLGLMLESETSLMPWYYVPIGAVCLWLLGQLAVIGPARNASRIAPAVATRCA